MEIIRLKNMIFYGYHGVEESESILGARFEVDLLLECDLEDAVTSDKLEDTVNYEAIYHDVERIVTREKHYLIESLAGTICKTIKENYSRVKTVTAVIRKPSVPIKGVLDTVEVEVTR